MGAVGPWEEGYHRWPENQGPPGHNLANETPGERRTRERTHRNPYFSEEFLGIIATVYELQTVQKWMDGTHPALQSESLMDHQRERFDTPEKMKRLLLGNGAEPWMFEEIPASGAERMAFLAEKSTPERRWRVFPYGAALKPWHIEEIRNNRDPFIDPHLDDSKSVGEPADWQDYAITDLSRPWEIDVSPHPTTSAPIYSFNLGSRVEPGSPWYGGDAIEPFYAVKEAPAAIFNTFKAGVGMRSRQRDEAMEDHAAAVRSDPRYNAAYFAEMERIKNMPQEERMALYDNAESQGFNSVFGTSDILDELRPGHFTAVSSLGAMIPGTEAHKRDPGTAELGVLPLGLGTESGVPQSRGSAGNIAERLAKAEAGQYMARRGGRLQMQLENLEHERGQGRVSEEEYRQKSADLLHLSPPSPAPQGGETPAQAPTRAPTQPVAPPEPAEREDRGIDITPQKRWYEVE